MGAKNKFWQFRAASDNPKVGELLLYGTISSESWWGDEVTPKQFKKDMDALGELDELKVFINSPGGDVFAGQAILSMLKRHPAQVTSYIDGLAASAASIVPMAGKVIMPRNAMMMVHKAWTWGVGNSDDFRKLADDLDKIGESIISAYEEKTGLDRDEITELLTAETWMTADEALGYGFVDEIEEAKQVAASISGNMLSVNGQIIDLSRFRNPPKLAFLPPEKPNPESNPTPKGRVFDYKKRVDVREKQNRRKNA